MFDEKTPRRDETADARPDARKDAAPAPETPKDDAAPTDYHYTDWALI